MGGSAKFKKEEVGNIGGLGTLSQLWVCVNIGHTGKKVLGEQI